MSVYFTVGPSQLYPTIQEHISTAINEQVGSLNHRSQKFREIYKECDITLRELMNIPHTHAIFFTNSATEIWERILFNTVDQKSFHFVNGAFSKRFYEYALALKKQPVLFEVGHGLGFSRGEINIPKDTELICTTQNETSSGVRISPNDLVWLKQQYPNCLLCTDIVSSAPIEAIDYTSVDMAFFSVQKAFGLPPGLGVWIVNENCLHKMKYLQSKNLNIGAHFTLESFFSNYQKFETPSTPNVLGIYLLTKVAKDLLNRGIENVRKELALKKEILETAILQSPSISLLVAEPSWRSYTTIVASTAIDSKIIIDTIKQNLDFVLGSGYGKHKQNEIRIANFPATTVAQIEKLAQQIAIV